MEMTGRFASLDLVSFLPHEFITINPFSAGLHYSHAIFEGMSMIKVDGNLTLFHPWLNLERMRHNASTVALGMDAFPDDKIIANIFSLAVINGFHKPGSDMNTIERAGKAIQRFYTRPLLFAESDSLGLGAEMKPRFLTIMQRMGEYLKYDKNEGISTLLFPFPRNLALPSTKTASNYQISIISRRKMEQFNTANDECCAEALFLNRNGHLIEGSGENVVLLRGNKLLSPASSEGAIPGITLRMVSTIAERLGLEFRFATFGLKDLEESDCLFLTGNAAGIVPVSSIIQVDGDYKLRKRHRFQSSSNKIFQKLKHEYELMETAQGDYARYHTCMADWIDEDEQDTLYEYGRRFLQRMQKAHRSRPFLQSNMPRLRSLTAAATRKDTLIEEYGIGRFYSNDTC